MDISCEMFSKLSVDLFNESFSDIHGNIRSIADEVLIKKRTVLREREALLKKHLLLPKEQQSIHLSSLQNYIEKSKKQYNDFKLGVKNLTEEEVDNIEKKEDVIKYVTTQQMFETYFKIFQKNHFFPLREVNIPHEVLILFAIDVKNTNTRPETILQIINEFKQILIQCKLDKIISTAYFFPMSNMKVPIMRNIAIQIFMTRVSNYECFIFSDDDDLSCSLDTRKYYFLSVKEKGLLTARNMIYNYVGDIKERNILTFGRFVHSTSIFLTREYLKNVPFGNRIQYMQGEDFAALALFHIGTIDNCNIPAKGVFYVYYEASLRYDTANATEKHDMNRIHNLRYYGILCKEIIDALLKDGTKEYYLAIGDKIKRLYIYSIKNDDERYVNNLISVIMEYYNYVASDNHKIGDSDFFIPEANINIFPYACADSLYWEENYTHETKEVRLQYWLDLMDTIKTSDRNSKEMKNFISHVKDLLRKNSDFIQKHLIESSDLCLLKDFPNCEIKMHDDSVVIVTMNLFDKEDKAAFFATIRMDRQASIHQISNGKGGRFIYVTYNKNKYLVNDYNDMVNKESLYKLHGGVNKKRIIFFVIALRIILTIIILVCVYLCKTKRENKNKTQSNN
jgi:hypothetical protein